MNKVEQRTPGLEVNEKVHIAVGPIIPRDAEPKTAIERP